MGSSTGQFDLSQLSRCIDRARADRDLTWAEVSAQVGVATSTIRRYATAWDAEADGVLALIGWLDAEPEQFIVSSMVVGTPLPQARKGVIRVDMTRLAALPTWPRQPRVGTRTTIQRLAKAAQGAGTPLATLTRWSRT